MQVEPVEARQLDEVVPRVVDRDRSVVREAKPPYVQGLVS